MQHKNKIFLSILKYFGLIIKEIMIDICFQPNCKNWNEYYF